MDSSWPIFLFTLLTTVTLASSAPLCDATPISTVDVESVCLSLNDTVDCSNQNLKTNLTTLLLPSAATSLNMDYNFLTEVSRLPESTSLAVVSFVHNRIARVEDGAFEHLPKLRELSLRDNFLNAEGLTPDSLAGPYDKEYFTPLISLRKLDLSINQFETLHQDIFAHLPNLEELNLMSNPIKIIDDNTRIALTSIAYLKVLDISYTGINQLPEYFLHGSAYLKILNLEANHFAECPVDFIKDDHELVKIILQDNPVVIEDAEKCAIMMETATECI